MRESMMHRCHVQVWVHPGLTTWELAEVTKINYYVLERRLPALRNRGLVKNGETRLCRIKKKPCLTWLPAGEGADKWVGDSATRPELLPHERPPTDPALMSPPDPEVERRLQAGGGRVHGWITREAIDNTKRVWSPSYKYALSDNEAIEILLNYTGFVDALVAAETQPHTGIKKKAPPISRPPAIDYSI
jgi:hypothetical protein